MLGRVFKGKVVLGGLLCFERFLQSTLTQWAESESLLLYLGEAYFTESMAAVEVAWDAFVAVEVFVAGGALHIGMSKLFLILNYNLSQANNTNLISYPPNINTKFI